MPQPPRPSRPRAHDRRRRGNYAILVAVSASSLLGMGAVAIDATYMSFVRAQSQALADIGAHAALVGLRETGDPATARDLAVSFVGANKLVGLDAIIDPDTDIDFGTWDFAARSFDSEDDASPNSVQVTVRKTDDSANGSYRTLLMGLFGEKHAEVSTTQPAIGALRSREIMVVQDVTGSFSDEIELAREADLAFLDYIAARDLPNDAIGMVTFVGAAEVYTPLSSVANESGAIRSQWELLDWCDRNYYPWNDPSSPYYYGGALVHKTDAPMMDCNTGSTGATYWYDSGTNQGSGLYTAVEKLLEDEATDPYALKVIVLVSDGAPACPGGGATCEATYRADGIEAADWAEENNISIFSVSFNETYSADQSAYMESLVRGYGAFYETPDPADLPAILEAIARSIPIALVD